MNINDCTICNRGNVDCNYKLDCSNDIKRNNVQSPCPGFGNKILDCDIDKPCPVYIKIDPPNPLLKRNIPDKVALLYQIIGENIRYVINIYLKLLI